MLKGVTYTDRSVCARRSPLAEWRHVEAYKLTMKLHTAST